MSSSLSIDIGSSIARLRREATRFYPTLVGWRHLLSAGRDAPSPRRRPFRPCPDDGRHSPFGPVQEPGRSPIVQPPPSALTRSTLAGNGRAGRPISVI